jgi:UPF0755 protein
MTDRPYDDAEDEEYTEYDDVPGPLAYDPADDDRSFGWEDEVSSRRVGGGRGGGGRGGGGRGGGPRFAAPRRRRGPRIFLGVAIVGLLLVAFVGVWVQRQINPSGSPDAPHTVVVPAGSTSSAIGKLLAKDGVISSSFVWDWYLRINGGGPFEAGEYQLGDNTSMGAVVSALQRGPLPPAQKRVTVPEGFTVKQTLARLASPTKGLGLDLTKLQQALASGQVHSSFQPPGETSSEGILFPDTYEVDPKTDELAVLQLMVQKMDETLTQLDVTSAQTTYHLTPYEILTVASLIEEETKVPEERAKVARVIYNRIKQGIPLGIDATSRYEAELAGRDRSKVDFTSSSPYNTRKHKGLPPTPIAAPGRASIEAALHPDDGDWIYYVLQDSAGHHLFTASASEFAAAKQRCHAAGLGCG